MQLPCIFSLTLHIVTHLASHKSLLPSQRKSCFHSIKARVNCPSNGTCLNSFPFQFKCMRAKGNHVQMGGASPMRCCGFAWFFTGLLKQMRYEAHITSPKGPCRGRQISMCLVSVENVIFPLHVVKLRSIFKAGGALLLHMSYINVSHHLCTCHALLLLLDLNVPSYNLLLAKFGLYLTPIFGCYHVTRKYLRIV